MKLTKKSKLYKLQLEKEEWKKCAIELAEKLTRFQLKGYLSYHDMTLARFNQLILKYLKPK